MGDQFYTGCRTARFDVDPVRRSLAHVYGQADGGIAPLEPDLIGEHHVATVGDIELLEGCLRWIEAEHSDLQEQGRRALLTVLQRATQSEHGKQVTARAAVLLAHLVGAHAATFATALVTILVDIPGALAGVLNRKVEDLDTSALEALHHALPERSLLLLDVSLRIAVRRVDLARHALTTCGGNRTARLLEDFTCAVSDTHLAVSAAQVDADMIYGRCPLGQYPGTSIEAGPFIIPDQAQAHIGD